MVILFIFNLCKLFFQNIDQTFELLGSFRKVSLTSEEPARQHARRSLVVNHFIPKGKKIEYKEQESESLAGANGNLERADTRIEELNILKIEKNILKYKLNENIIQKWIKEDLVECEEVKPFNSIYDSFIIWCENEGINHKKYPKRKIKKELEKIQLKTKHGLIYGAKLKDDVQNGSKSYPKFNFCSIEDIDDD